MELSFLFGWAVTATIAAVWYSAREQFLKKRMLWNLKMMIQLAANKAKVTRQGDTLTFFYENEYERNEISVQVRDK